MIEIRGSFNRFDEQCIINGVNCRLVDISYSVDADEITSMEFKINFLYPSRLPANSIFINVYKEMHHVSSLLKI